MVFLSNSASGFLKQIRMIHFAIIAGVTVVYLLTGNQWLLIQIIAVLGVMIINRPTAEKIVNEIGLERSDIQAIQEL